MTMQQATVGSKYQIVIPKDVRRKIKDLNPGDSVKVYTEDDQTITIKVTPKDWLERTRGIAKEAWKDIDTTQYLEDLRNEWDKEF